MAQGLRPHHATAPSFVSVALLAVVALGGCDKVPLLGPNRDAEGRAVGGACRHAGRALSDCYAYNPDLPKAAIFAGWRDMNDYMLDKKIEVVDPVLPAEVPKPPPSEGEGEGEGAHAAEPEKPSRRERARAERIAAEARAQQAKAAAETAQTAPPEAPPGPTKGAEAKPALDPRVAPQAEERAAPHAERKVAPHADAKAAPHAEAKVGPPHDAKAAETRPSPPGGPIRPEPTHVVAAAEPARDKDKARDKPATDKKGEHH